MIVVTRNDEKISLVVLVSYQCLGVKPKMFFDEGADKEITVVITLAFPILELLSRCFTGALEFCGLKLIEVGI